LIGLTNLTTNGRVLVEPKLNRRRALFVLEPPVLARSHFAQVSAQVDEPRVLLLLGMALPGQDLIPYLMAIHELLPRRIHYDLQQVGWAKAAELAKVARRDGDRFDCATWLHKAIELPKKGFKREVEKHLTGQETEPWEIIYFKLYKSQLPEIERALETAALMLGASKSRGYCLEMICADFLAGAHLEGGNSDSLLFALGRLYSLLPDPQKLEFVQQMGKVQ
jgi:hypothetical protein